ncbi:MAG: NADH-quinone oxidoreductase subunit N [Acidobacteria bacterium]|nr:NADH-quinone oxidoreductase subunit N [Acidobacteriota bacterium]
MNVTVNMTALMPLIILFAGISLTALMGTMKDSVKRLAGLVASISVVFAFWWVMERILPAIGTAAMESQSGMLTYSYYSVFLSGIVLITAVAAFALSEHYLLEEDFSHPEFYAILLASITGMMVMLNTSNFVNIFIGLELLSIPLYASVAYLRYKPESVEGGLKYFILGAIASGFLAYGIAMIYGASGSLDFITIVKTVKTDSLFRLGLLFILMGLAFKAAAVPFHMWAPDAYEGAATPVTAFMSIAPKAVAIGVLIRILYSVFPQMVDYWREAVLVLSILTVIVGNFAAIVQQSVKRMLAYSSISHAGYLLMGIVAYSVEGVSGILFYLAGYMLINTGAFGVLSLLKIGDDDFVSYDDIRGIGYRYPLLGIFMSVFMFSLAGIPATVGFMGKFYVFKALIHANYMSLALVGIGGSLVSVYYYLRVVVHMYMKENPEERKFNLNFLSMTVLAICSVLVIAAGLFPAKIADIANVAARFMN